MIIHVFCAQRTRVMARVLIAVAIVLLMAACPEPRSNKKTESPSPKIEKPGPGVEITPSDKKVFEKPGVVTALLYKEKGDTLTITATPPVNRGKTDTRAVGEKDIKYALFYAQIGADGAWTYADTDAIKSKAEESGVADTVAGKKEIQGNSALATGFTVTGVTEDTIYRYFIRSIHPDDDTAYSDTSETLGFVLKPNKSLVIPYTLADGKARTKIKDREYIGTKRKPKLTNVLIPSSVASIGNKAFFGNELKSVTIGNGVISIGWDAFRKNQLMSVIIPNSVTSIGTWAFYNNQLKSLTIGNGVTSIGRGAFQNNKLMSVTIPDSVKSINPYTFMDNQLKSLTIGNEVTSIGKKAFFGNKLESVTIGNQVISIGEGAFQGNQLTSVVIPSSVISIGESAFQGNQLKSLTIGNRVISIGNSAFMNNQLTNVSIPNSVTSIGKDAFWGNSLTSVTIMNSGTSVGDGAFTGNGDLTTVTLPQALYNTINTLPRSLKKVFGDKVTIYQDHKMKPLI